MSENKIIRNCLICEREFVTNPSEARRGNGRFCSKACGVRSRIVPMPDCFWQKVDKNGPSHPSLGACWPWAASLDAHGYGQFRIMGRSGNATMGKAHRVAWALTNGEIPCGMHILHKCDNPACVNPAHLFLGTHQDNMADMMAKGRARNGGGMPGDSNPKSKLIPAQVLEIRNVCASPGASQEQIAARYGVSRVTVNSICRRRTWKHI